MYRYTTPTHIFDTNISLVEAEVIWVTYKQGSVELTKTKEDCEVTPEQVIVQLTQEETALFKANCCKNMGYPITAQIRARFPDGTAVACNEMQVALDKILKEGVI